ncbi:DarT ssDNA thymidine ADP-ribosyltransferase family protein [Tropicimonas sp. IMCC6043]|uniref:DarT ssDNA thymidine ADP-ribosyltransferase family protein n=1 Tax=Tropicimonas sp. IMCC6043 TaxID=2510645 RepID=UPI00101DC427|nr:DarT ssDNA thymidine ADP-ribosyltransferase family protein [Tropicimonas sp. IMCC6043]RYH09154.1 DUF4433 domain-containing protein [Tropicimonas sp. IMCC6043]
MNSTKIRNAVRWRGITSLYHFTPTMNLESILTHGLLSRTVMEENEIDYVYSDSWRKDGYLNAVSVSIHDINQSMFSKKIRNSSCTWVILEIDASVLWTHPCRFCWINAASSEIVKHSRFIGGPWAFNEMFADRSVSIGDERSFRAVFNTPDNMPTRNDAEVQVLSPIAPELIRDVTVAHDKYRSATETTMKAAGRLLPIAIVPEAFT